MAFLEIYNERRRKAKLVYIWIVCHKISMTHRLNVGTGTGKPYRQAITNQNQLGSCSNDTGGQCWDRKGSIKSPQSFLDLISLFIFIKGTLINAV